jgi:hypothetical protein
MDDNRAGLATATLVAGGWRSQVWGWAPPSLGWCPGGNLRDVVNCHFAQLDCAPSGVHSNRPEPLDAELDRPRWWGAVTA